METNKNERLLVRFCIGSGVLTCKVLRPVIFKIGEVSKMKCIDTIRTEIPISIDVADLDKTKSDIIKKIIE